MRESLSKMTWCLSLVLYFLQCHSKSPCSKSLNMLSVNYLHLRIVYFAKMVWSSLCSIHYSNSLWWLNPFLCSTLTTFISQVLHHQTINWKVFYLWYSYCYNVPKAFLWIPGDVETGVASTMSHLNTFLHSVVLLLQRYAYLHDWPHMDYPDLVVLPSSNDNSHVVKGNTLQYYFM